MAWSFSIAFLGAAAAAGLLAPVAMRVAEALGLVDVPGPRKVHARPIPRVGGVAIALATALTAAVALLALPSGRALLAASGSEAYALLVCTMATGLVLALGLADDAFDLPAKYKLAGLIAASLLACAGGARIEGFSFYGDLVWDAGWASWPLTVLWIVGVVVSVNFIDGLDGLAGGVCLIAAATLALIAGLHDFLVVAVAAVAIAGALAGFLVHNWHPARLFMGDGGSMSVGFALASLTVLSSRGHGTFSGLIVPALPLTLPVIDTALTLVRRHVLQRRSLFAAEQGHLHHRLLQLGFGHVPTVLIFHGVSLIAAASGLLMLFGTLWLKAAGLVAVVAMVMAVLRLAESAGVRETLAALRRNRSLLGESRRLQQVFEDQQLQFRHARDFEAWWAQVGRAAEAFGFLQLRLPATNRDGRLAVRKWCLGDGQFDDADVIAASVPVRQRRAGSVLKLEVHVGPSPHLEAASERLRFFSRLMDEHSVASLASTPQHNPHYAPRGVAVAGSIASLVQPPRTFGPTEACSPAALPERAAGARIAIVHDFLYTYAGAERVLEQMLEVYPQAELFSLFDFVPEASRGFLKGKPVSTSFIQRLPFARRAHRAFLPLMPLAIEQLDVSKFDVVLSSSYLAAKGVITRPDQLHVCYCHTPIRFAWDQQNQYLKTVGLIFGVKAIVSRLILHYIRTWDVRSANGVDVFLTNSNFVARRIEKVYRRAATTIYPPVAVDKFPLQAEKQDFYVTASRLVPYKRIDVIVEAFSRMPDRRLIVVGDGPELERIKAAAGPNVSLVGYQNDAGLRRYLQHARAFVFAAEEDFGIVTVEAQACGTPVIACGRGGATESVIAGQTGVFFDEQTADAIVDAVGRFERLTLDAAAIRHNAERFASERFRTALSDHVESAWRDHRARQLGPRGEAVYVDRPAAAAATDAQTDEEMGVACA